MSFKYAVLAALTGGAMHGYAVRTALHEAIGSFWPVGQGQVYATLERAACDGLTIEQEGAALDDPVVRRCHELTLEGRRRLGTWLSRTSAEERNDGLGFDDWLAHLAVAERRGDAAGLAATIAVQRARCERLHDALVAADDLPLRPAKRLARELLAAELEWLDDVEREISRDGPLRANA